MAPFWFMAIFVMPLALVISWFFPPALVVLPILALAGWAEHARPSREPEDAKAAIRGFAPAISESSEASLIERIPGMPVRDRLVAVDRLGRIGTEDGLALLDVLAGMRVGHEGVKQAAGEAARAIRSRLEEHKAEARARAGGLTVLTPGEAGALTLPR